MTDQQPPQWEERLQALQRKLHETWGTDLCRLRPLFDRLADAGWHSPADLVRVSALSHRTVADLLHRLEPWLEQNRDLSRLCPEAVPRLAPLFPRAASPLTQHQDPWEQAASAHPLLASMTDILKTVPRSDRHLDHVSATPLTCVKRALFLADQYHLAGAEILFLGDHDLTSVALAHLFPDLPIWVLDVDERILACIGSLARERGWPIHTLFADLRVELPRSLEGRFDLVFTDPPYTPAGVRLFLGRGSAALREAPYARLLLSYGFGESQLGLGFKVQSVLHELRLIVEAVLPRFNRYLGAEAIGSASNLYLCRPTRRTRAAATAVETAPGIYTQGRNAEETKSREWPAPVVRAVGCLLSSATADLTLIGDGWPPGLSASPPVSLGGYLRAMYLGQGKPPFTREPHAGVVAANLYPHFGNYLLRLLLIAAAERLVVCAPDRDLRLLFLAETALSLRPLLESVYQTAELVRGDAESPGVVVLDRLPVPESSALHFVLRYLVDHRRARLDNAWREALIQWAACTGAPPLTKNQAREQLRQSGFPAIQLTSYLSELPLGDLQALVAAIPRSLQAASPQSI